MNTEEVRERVRLGEDSRTEFKREEVHEDDLAASLTSFANGAGGMLILGVADDRAVRGVRDPDRTILRIDNISRQNVEPPLTNVTVEKHSIEGNVVLVVHAPRGPQRPYRTNRGVYFVRGAAGRRMATRQELLEIYQSAGSLFPDEIAVEDAGEGDLDRDSLLDVRPELKGMASESMGRALIAMKVMADERHPTVGGLLCFGRDPQQFKPYARITAIRHKGTDVSEEFLDRRELGGTLRRQIAEAQAFLREHLASARHPGPRPIYSMPFDAFDEALVNAVAHRDYLALSQVRLFLFDDRLEVVSPGMLLNTVTIDNVKLGFHLVRNPIVFNHLVRARLATDAGRGIPTMIQRARASGLPEPEFACVGAEFRVTFRLRN